MERLVNLHIHTNVSDGVLSPAEIVKRAKACGLSAIAITDHDTVYGLMDALLWGHKLQIEVIPGIELSTRFLGEEVHIVGLFIDYTYDWFINKLRQMREFRKKRAQKMLLCFNKIGIPITHQDLLEEAGNANIGRPHFARLLKRKGYVQDIQEAFDKFMLPGKPCYVPKFNLSAPSAIKYIHRLKGLAFMAHPIYNNWHKIIPALKEQGLDGIEALHSSHPPELQLFFIQYARENGLLISGGSDFHTPDDPTTKLDAVNISYAFLDVLKKHIKGILV